MRLQACRLKRTVDITAIEIATPSELRFVAIAMSHFNRAVQMRFITSLGARHNRIIAVRISPETHIAETERQSPVPAGDRGFLRVRAKLSNV